MTLHDTEDRLRSARTLELPSRDAMLRRDPSVQAFWADNRQLLADAWSEWDADDAVAASVTLDDSLLDPQLRRAVAEAWTDPAAESAVRNLLHEAAPGVFEFQFFDPERLGDLRNYLEAVWDAGIPLRPPYGIVLNRRGAMLDARSEGSLAAPSFQTFYRLLMDSYMRPIARLLFPEITGLRRSDLRLLDPLSARHRHLDPSTHRRVVGDAQHQCKPARRGVHRLDGRLPRPGFG